MKLGQQAIYRNKNYAKKSGHRKHDAGAGHKQDQIGLFELDFKHVNEFQFVISLYQNEAKLPDFTKKLLFKDFHNHLHT